MKELFASLGNAARACALYAPKGPLTPKAPISPPPGFEPPPPLAKEENGYARLETLTQSWPDEGHFPPDLKHRLKVGRADVKSAERALRPLRPVLDRIDEALDLSQWQARITPDVRWPELSVGRRWGYALLLRGLVDGRPEDRDRAIELARRLRRSQGVFLHLLMSVSLEKVAEGDLQGLAEDRAAAVHWDLRRMEIPYAPLFGPWDPPLGADVADSKDQRRAARWLLAGHPNAYDPAETVARLLDAQDAMSSGTSEELRKRLESIAEPWPRSLWVPGGYNVKRTTLAELRAARPRLRGVGNPYGRLAVAWKLHVAAGVAKLVEDANKATV